MKASSQKHGSTGETTSTSTYAFISMISMPVTGMVMVIRMNALRMGFTMARTVTSSPNRTKNWPYFLLHSYHVTEETHELNCMQVYQLSDTM